MRFIYYLLVIFLLPYAPAWALPECEGDTKDWNDCEGVQEWNGVKYEGEFKNSLFDGRGKYTSDAFIYEGIWKEGKLHGQGTLTRTNGNIYIGEFKDGKKHGLGTKTLSNGTKYVGEWKNNFPDGQGKYVSGDFYYFGGFKKESYHGDGIWMNNRTGAKYVGKFENDKRHGFGTLSTEFFDVEGLFSNGKFINGKVINKIDGLISEGEFNGYMRF